MKVIHICDAIAHWQQKFFEMRPGGYTYRPLEEYELNSIPLLGKKYNKTLTQGLVFAKHKREIQLLHSFNKIPVQNIQWLLEVESYLPRFFELNIQNRHIDNWLRHTFNHERCKKIIFISQYARNLNEERLKRWGVQPNKCDVIYPAVDIREPQETPSDTFTVTFVGRNFFRKGGKELIEAFLRYKKSDWKLNIVSNFMNDYGPIRATKEEVAGMQDRIKRSPQIKHIRSCPHHLIPSLLVESDVFVSMTYADTFNCSVAEAIGFGLPVVATDIAAIPEMVRNDYNGYLFENPSPGDNERIVDFLGSKLQKLYHDTALRNKMSLRSLEIAKRNFSFKKRLDQYERIYQSILT